MFPMTPSDPQHVEISFATPLVIVQANPQPRAVFTFQTETYTSQGENMSQTMQVGTYATLSVAWKDQGGNIVKVDGPTTWASTDPLTLQVTVAAGNPSIANLYAPGPLGPETIYATADADLGDGVKTITSKIDIEVISGQAVGGDLTFTQSPAQGPQKGKLR